MIPREYVFENLKDISILRDFQCGISSMDAFIQDGLDLSIQNHYCNAYIVMENRKGSEILALFALSFDSLDLDIEDKNEVISGVSNAGIPQLTDNYKDVFLNKSHYPALEIAYLAVAKNFINVLDTKELMADMLNTGFAKDINVYIGEENEKEELKDFSIVTFKHRIGNKELGTIGIIGPKRMNYAKVISVMKYISKKLNGKQEKDE